MHIRKIPPEIGTWITDQSHARHLTKNDFVLSVLKQSKSGKQQYLLFDDQPELKVSSFVTGVPFTFCDLFAGIGGMRIGLEAVGGECVYSCEYDKHAQKTYSSWFGEMPDGDIRDISPADIPDHDLLAAGFPCQPFSIAGVSKKNSLGKAHGFKDKTQGTLFFHLATIIELKRPPVFLLENVKNLMSHDRGRTWKIIRETLEGLDYETHFKVIDAVNYVPQKRKRVFIIGFDRKEFSGKSGFEFPQTPETKPVFRDILETRPDKKYTLTDHLWNYLQEYANRHKQKGNGFGFGLTDLNGSSRTLSARYYKDGSEVLIPQRGKNPRRLTRREAARLMGFPDRLPIVVSDTQAYKQFGNAVVPIVVESVGKGIVNVLTRKLMRSNGCLLKKRTASTK